MMKRRIFLQRLAATSLFTSLAAGWTNASISDRHIFARPDLIDILEHPSDVKAIGEAFLHQHPMYRNKTFLHDIISRRIGSRNNKNLRWVISQKVKEDFEIGNTMQLNGWILSRLEAQQCALFSLTNI